MGMPEQLRSPFRILKFPDFWLFPATFFAAGTAVQPTQSQATQLCILGAIFLAAALFAFVRKYRIGWKWPGAKPSAVAKGIGVLAFGAYAIPSLAIGLARRFEYEQGSDWFSSAALALSHQNVSSGLAPFAFLFAFSFFSYLNILDIGQLSNDT